MKLKFLMSISALCILNMGCTLSDNLLRTSVVQPIQYSSYWDLKLERRRFRKLAQVELERAQAAARAESDNYSCPPFSLDEEKGFEAGFVDYLSYGGTGNPPPLPPRRYWWSGCEHPLDYNSIQDWFRGFQHGAAVAQASGYRNCVMVPLSDGLVTDTLPIYFNELSETEYVEPIDTPLGELEVPASVRIEIPDLPTSATPTHNTQPLAAAESLPSSWEQLLRDDKFPTVIPSEPSPGTPSISENEHATSIASNAIPLPRATATRPTSSGTRPTHLLAPADAAGFAGVPDLIEIKKLPANRKAMALPPTPFLSAPQNAPLNGNWRYWEVDQLIERDETPPSQPETSSDQQDASPASPTSPASPASPASPSAMNRAGQGQTNLSVAKSTPTLAQPRRNILAGALLLVAGGFLLVRHPKVSIELPRERRLRATYRSHSTRMPTSTSTATIDPAAQSETSQRAGTRRAGTRRVGGSQAMWLVLFACCWMAGCSSLTNPVLNGIPVRKLPPELLSQPHRDHLQTIPLSMLRQKQPTEYLLAAGDVLGVFIAGVFPPTTADQALTSPPVYFPSQIDPLGAGLPPSLGYPVTIRNDGTLALPLIDPISLDGLTVEQANERVRSAYADKGILQPGRESVMLTLMQPRQIRVLVFRQEVGGFSAGGRGDISSNNVKQGTGHIVDLRAYENDVVNALANSGGLPGLDSYAGVYIFRGGQSNPELTQTLQSLPSGKELSALSSLAVKTDYIPTRWLPSEPVPFQPEDVILNEGDVVLLEARIEDLFYTAGLLPAGERVLPRDYDLDVVEAVVQVSGTLVNGAFGGNNFNGLLIQKGIGNPNPSALTVIRRTPNGGQIPISVDLNRALVDPRERILVQPGDLLILQETRNESVARYFNSLFNFNIFWQVFSRGDVSGATAITQLPSI